jgi:hypothetical protein
MRSRITKIGAVIVLVASALAVTVGTVRAAGRAPVAQAVQLTGSQLAAVLLPAGAFPSGYRYDKSTSYESGKRLETGKAKYHLMSISCTMLSNVYGRSGFGETAAATNSYSTLVDNLTATSGAAFAQTVYQFASASAARSFWRGIRSVVVRCPGFGLATHLGSGTERIVKVSIRGTQAFQADFSGSLASLGTIGVQSLVVVRGQDVIETDAMGLARAVPASPSLRTLMTRLLARVPATIDR